MAKSINPRRTWKYKIEFKVKGNRKGQHSIRINDQWRICFVWKDESAIEVEIVDYHKG